MAKTLEEIQKEIQDIQSQMPELTQKVGEAISSANIQPSTEIPFKSPEESSVYDITKLNNYSTPPLEITEPEKKAQTLTEQLQALNLSLIGESAYKTEKETEQDIVGLTKTKTDLSNQLKILQNEALAIPQQMQVEATGRGITAGGLKPLETARLRTNAIAALGVSAMLEAANGNLATANDLVDRAVKAKFDPIREEISAKMDNLNLILKSPDYTIAEKNRAQAQLDIQNAKKDAADKAEAEQKGIWGIATTAAQNGADALALQKIQQAKTKEEALQIAQQAGIFKQIGAGQYLGLTGTQATTFQTDLEVEITNVYSGKYGTKGAREQALARLQSKYPGLAVADLIYGNPTKGIPATFPDGYENKIITTGKKEIIYNEKTIKPELRQDVIDTLTDKEGAKTLGRELTLLDMIRLFPNVDQELLQDYMDQFYDYEELVKEEKGGEGEKKWWQFWK